ncbi:hypothetical protein PF005_g8851 [Phytophthora fragariae]|uniref:Uncharacterized protein n=1 Tax=Phytophthora fragariae TaxID=53985 RepID=A0A6A3TMW4_9STRA|nr:hypothetical protein PF003_g25114 [Phytophthora fragariae]KAE9075981.1 hypothetical protein PF010_g24087 [Phytophthora fragariae]KAE9112172.1 hypothetical protein PF007_g11200 [Phytophthora fragariae]KAE9140301.1 hypothetical protein PF006_g13564 [Phytophthora fragariae]KAE9216933.1 hypothetical protein PF005_g8851 [Phytophthora fragariae]
MGKIIDWGELAKALPPEPAAIELERLKSYKTTKCQSMTCVVCADPYPHLMTYRLFKCKSKTCAHAVPYLDCTWRGKLITSAKHKVASLFEFGKHHTSASFPKRSSMTSRQKEFCKSLTQQRLKPKRSHSLMRHQFNLSAEVMLPLRAVQNCVNYHARKTLGNNDFYDDITAFVREQFFTGYEEETKPFTFTWPVDNDGRSYVGDGGDAEPFFVGISTKQLLK